MKVQERWIATSKGRRQCRYIAAAGRAGDTTDLMQPVIIGWNTQRGPRPPDVLVLDERNVSPQYAIGDTPAIVNEGKTKPLLPKSSSTPTSTS